MRVLLTLISFMLTAPARADLPEEPRFLPSGQTASSPVKALAQTTAIINATIHTAGSQGTLENATLVLENGNVAAVGTDVEIPEGARIVDADGRTITPGLFDVWGSMGVAEIPGVEQTVDAAVVDRRISASFNVADAINPRSTVIAVNRAEGISSAIVAPEPNRPWPPNGGTGNLIAGQAVAIDLGGGDGWLLKSPAALAVALGEGGAALAGGSRAAAMHRLREALQDARDYGNNRDAFERRARREYALSRLDLEALQPVVRGEVPVVASVNRASDIEAVLRLAGEFGLRLIVNGGAEAWMVADKLAAVEVPVLLDPLLNLPSSFDGLAATSENAARLHAAGVTIALTAGGHNARNVRQSAGNAVARGLPWDAALEAITVNPARIFGLAEHTGSIEPGKSADIVLWDGDPLEVTSFPDQAWIGGEEVPMRTRHTELRDRYMEKLL